MTTVPYQLGLSSLNQEVEAKQLQLQGTLPAWLTGKLIRTGPALFEVGEQTYRHWFDGLAMLRKFSFEAGQVFLTNKFLRSKAYLEAQAKGKISRGEFGTVARHSILERVRDPIPRLTDNANVNITMLGEQIVSVTESPKPIAFDPETLCTLGRFKYQDRLNGQITTAHPHLDTQKNTLFSYMTRLGPRCAYNIYAMKAGSKSRQLVGSIPVKQPAYMHSFGMTEHYIILTEYPFVLSPLSLLFSGRPFIENCFWSSKQGTRILVISKADGRLITTCESEPFFAFHHVNAFERDHEIVLDLVAFPDTSVIKSLYLESLESETSPTVNVGELRRYRVPLNGTHATYEVPSAERIELPRINYRQGNAKDYQFVYGVGNHQPNNFTDQLVKVNVQNGEAKVWRSESCYPGEPVFVAAPDASAEDEGIVLSVVLDAQAGQSFLLVLDAQSFQEIARAEVPFHLPFDFHGQYFEDMTQPHQSLHLHR